MTEKHKNVHVALAAAQAEMGHAKKSADNPHFKSKYADLAEVVEVAKPALTKHGLAFYHTVEMGDPLHFMVTVIVHGESATDIRCAVPLMIGRQDMQSFKSATTYAKRIGLESLTGIAPDDDDGNAAASTPAPEVKSFAQTITDEMDPDSTPEERAQAIAEAVERLWPRKKTPGQLQNAWTKLENEGLFRRLEKQHPALYDRVFDAYEEQLRKVSPEPQVAAE